MNYKVFSEVEVLKDILLSYNYPKWNNVIKLHSDNYLNLSDDEIEASLASQQPNIIADFFNATGKGIKSGKDLFFNEFNEDPEVIVKNPCSYFLLNKNDQEIIDLMNSYGVIVQNNNPNEDIISKRSYEELIKGHEYYDGPKKGWHFLTDKEIFNSFIISDPHLFDNEEKGKNIGLHNILNLLDAILPDSLITTFHLLIIVEEKSNGKLSSFFNKIKADLIDKIDNLRSYEFLVEVVVTSNIIHKRRAFSNNFVISCDKGFKLFKVSDDKKCFDDNDFELKYFFHANNPNDGKPNFYEFFKKLPNIKKGINEVLEWRRNQSEIHNKRCYGIEEPEFKIVNRLYHLFN
ncbi:hypothetical protein [Empedobacter tilapiae]